LQFSEEMRVFYTPPFIPKNVKIKYFVYLSSKQLIQKI